MNQNGPLGQEKLLNPEGVTTLTFAGSHKSTLNPIFGKLGSFSHTKTLKQKSKFFKKLFQKIKINYNLYTI